jgi:hypothetical protein
MPETTAVIPAILELVNMNRGYTYGSDAPIRYRLEEKDVQDVLFALTALDFKIIHNTVIVDDYKMQQANEVISAWMPEGIEPEDINAAQIFIDLKSKGWVIVPPVS